MDEAGVQGKARSFIASLDLRNIREDLSVYLKEVNAVLLEEELGPNESGSSVKAPNGKHVITVNSREEAVRQRFTICHEIAHIVLELPSQHSEVPSWSYVKRDQNEIACDTFAAELLMPYKQWLEKIPNAEPSHEVIELMAGEFKCSYPAAASRYASLAPLPCAFVRMESGTVRYAGQSTSLRRVKAWIPVRTPIPPGSVANRLRSEGLSQVDSGEVSQDIWFENWEQGLDLTEISRHYKSSDTTLSLLWFEEDELPAQEVDRFGRVVDEDEGLKELTGELPWPGRRRRK